MITKFRKMQDTWFAKIILILTGLSFVSLFGVAGYMGSVGKNRPVIKVDSFELLQGDAYGQLDREIQAARKLLGDTFEVSDTIRQNMLQEIVQKNLNNMILRNIAKKNGVSISDDLVRKIIYAQPEFRNAEGKFDINRFRQILALSGMGETQYIDAVKLDIIRQNVLQTPVENLNVPAVLFDYMAKIYNQKRVFKYIALNLNELPIDRKISDEEIEQYYQDFNLNFMAPETRDISFIYLSNDELSNQVVISDEEAETFYKENASRYETPETRLLSQMVFDDQNSASEALNDLNAGKDFYKVAEERAGQSHDVTNLGYVAQDMMLEALSGDVFAASKGKVVGPLKTDMGWHIIKVEDIKSGSKMKKSKAISEIKDTLKKERIYDEAYELMSKIEDRIGAGEDFNSIAQSLNASIYTAKNLEEDGKAALSQSKMKDIVSAPDFVDMAFSYNEGEISQVIELDDGIALLKVDKVYDSHAKPLEAVKPEIIKMWQENERVAIAQEITNDVLHDLESGDSIDEIAHRFNLNLRKTAPLSRQQMFATLSEAEMNELFLETIGTPKVFDAKNTKVIVLVDKIINTDNTPQSTETVLRQTKLDIAKEYADRLLSDFSSDYDVRVKYRLLGLAD